MTTWDEDMFIDYFKFRGNNNSHTNDLGLGQCGVYFQALDLRYYFYETERELWKPYLRKLHFEYFQMTVVCM